MMSNFTTSAGMEQSVDAGFSWVVEETQNYKERQHENDEVSKGCKSLSLGKAVQSPACEKSSTLDAKKPVLEGYGGFNVPSGQSESAVSHSAMLVTGAIRQSRKRSLVILSSHTSLPPSHTSLPPSQVHSPGIPHPSHPGAPPQVPHPSHPGVSDTILQPHSPGIPHPSHPGVSDILPPQVPPRPLPPGGIAKTTSLPPQVPPHTLPPGGIAKTVSGTSLPPQVPPRPLPPGGIAKTSLPPQVPPRLSHPHSPPPHVDVKTRSPLPCPPDGHYMTPPLSPTREVPPALPPKTYLQTPGCATPPVSPSWATPPVSPGYATPPVPLQTTDWATPPVSLGCATPPVPLQTPGCATPPVSPGYATPPSSATPPSYATPPSSATPPVPIVPVDPDAPAVPQRLYLVENGVMEGLHMTIKELESASVLDGCNQGTLTSLREEGADYHDDDVVRRVNPLSTVLLPKKCRHGSATYKLHLTYIEKNCCGCLEMRKVVKSMVLDRISHDKVPEGRRRHSA